MFYSHESSFLPPFPSFSFSHPSHPPFPQPTQLTKPSPHKQEIRRSYRLVRLLPSLPLPSFPSLPFHPFSLIISQLLMVGYNRLVATLGAKSSATKKVTRKAILDVDVRKACETVREPEAPMALRLQSNLL
jgi:hypothetical protein